MSSLLFVCLGNICRSPLAEGIARKRLSAKSLHVKIDSAGTSDWHVGKPPCVDSIKIAYEHNLDISSLRARTICKEDAQNFEYIIAMDEQNIKDLHTFGIKNVIKLGDFGYNGEDVPDPYFFEDFKGFEKVYKMIDECLVNFIEQKY